MNTRTMSHEEYVALFEKYALEAEREGLNNNPQGGYGVEGDDRTGYRLSVGGDSYARACANRDKYNYESEPRN